MNSGPGIGWGTPTRGLAALAALVLAAAGAGAVPSQADRAMLEELRREDLRLATVAFRLANRAGPLCSHPAPLTGMLLHETGQYEPQWREAADDVFGLSGGAGVEGVVPGSPADRAGLRANDRVLRIGDAAVLVGPTAAKADFSSEAALLAQLDAATAQGRFGLGIVRDGVERSLEVVPVPGCASRVQLVPGSRHNASADGRTVTVSTAVLADTVSDDELAFLVAHEMSHNILGHRARLDGAGVRQGLFASFGGDARAVRRTEEEADYYALFLMARAGFDPRAAANFWQRFEHAHGYGIFADATHLNGRVRVRFLRLGAGGVAAMRDAGAELTPDLTRISTLEAQARTTAGGPTHVG